MDTLKTRTYMFRYDLFFLPCDPEDWYGVFPVDLTGEEFEELLEVYKEWSCPEVKKQASDLDGDDFFMKTYCPQILEKVKRSLKDYATKNWDEQVIAELNQANIDIPDEIYEM